LAATFSDGIVRSFMGDRNFILSDDAGMHTFRYLVLVNVVIFAAAMLGISFAAHRIVNTFGVGGGMATIALMYAAACWYDRRSSR
jgi:hypothetical protein